MKKARAVDDFMATMPPEGVTFDDVSIVPRYADFLPADVEIGSRLTGRIGVNIPFVSACMDTVTESRMAVSMAMLGGIGIIHRNLDIERQSREVESVKRHLHGVIRDPVTFRASDTLDKVRAVRAEREFNFSGFPVLDDNGNLAGILTGSDMKFAGKPNARVSDVMTREPIASGPGTSLEKAYAIMKRNKIGKLPLTRNGRLVGLYSFTDVSTLIENAKPLFNRDSKHRLRVGAAVGTGDQERVETLTSKNVDVLVIDTAHGHTGGVIEMCRWIKKHYSGTDVIAGNIATGDAALALLEAGADAVKVGIGPGSICTTRVVAGVGIPQITAIHNCARALRGRIPVIADGGIRYSGDVPKAIVAGADTVMMGSALAGTAESPSEKIIHQGRQYVVYRGMGSQAAMQSAGSRERYAVAGIDESQVIPQGVEGIVPFSGSLDKVLAQFCGGLRTSLGYCGCRTIGELQSECSFVRISHHGARESHVHDVTIIKEAPNYVADQ